MSDSPSTHPWLAQLNDEQRAAATYGGATLLILAGAGTGKTTTLCARVAHLVGEGTPLERILLLSFSRRAARELIERARGLCARVQPGARQLTGGTFHSIAHQMVRSQAAALGLERGFSILDAADAADVLAYVRQEQGAGERRRRFPRAQTLLDIYSRTVNSQQPLKQVLAATFPWCKEHQQALAEIFRAYIERKRKLGLLDLDDLLLHWRALSVDPVVGAHLAASFDHVLVDEYQDVNGLQADIVAGLHAHCSGLTVVGDDFQAIYGFRAASAEHILAFPQRFPGAHVLTLERNYRSTEAILAVANAVSAQDGLGFAKRLWTSTEGGGRPTLHFIRDETEQSGAVCDRVLAAREEGVDLRRQAVLFRTGHDSDLLELELTRRGIPFVKYGGLRYLEAAHVRDLIALLRLADNPADELSWFRVLQLLEGVGPARARRLLDALRGPGGGPPRLERFAEALEHVPQSSRKHARALLAALGEEPTQAAAVRVERLSQALAPLVALHYADGAVRVADLDQLAAAARNSVELRSFVAELVLDPPASSADWAQPPHLDEDYLVLSTVHSAKGLEWESVHLIAAYDGNFPADMSATDEHSIAEERRLFYVALTRAKRRLDVYVPMRYYHRPQGHDDAHGYGKPSRFLSDRVQECFAVRRSSEPIAAFRRPAPGAGSIEVSVEALFS